MPTLDEILAYGSEADPATGQPRANALQQAEAVRAWHRETVDFGRAATADPANPLPAEAFWQGTLAADADATQTLEALRTTAMAETTRTLFPDDTERADFLRVLDSSGGDPEAMDAPERWIQNARAIDQLGQARAFQAPRYQSGSIGIGPNVLGSYLVREKEDGSGYQAIVQPVGKDAQPLTVELPTLEDMRAKANARLAKTSQDYDLYAPGVEDMAMGEVGGSLGMGDFLETLSKRRESAQSRAELLNGPDLSAALHVGLDDNLTENPAFLDQLPGGAKAWAEQLTTRPLNQMVRGLAQAAAALPGTDNRALTQEGQDTVEVTTPGALANRYENSPEGTAPAADLIASGIESAGTLLLPGGLAKLGGRAVMGTKIGRAGAMANAMDEASGTALPFFSARAREAFVAENAGWGTMFATASGQSYAGTEQEAAAVEATDPAKAARLRRWNGLTSLAKGAIEMGTEKIFPGEMALLNGSRIPLGQLATMQLKEGTEEAVGAVAQNAVSAFTGQTMEDPAQAFRAGFIGGAPFVGAAALAGRISPPDLSAETPPSETPDATLFPPPDANPPVPGASAATPSLLAGIAQRGGREDPSAPPASEIPASVPIPITGRTTAYGYANDETPDANSSAGIGAFVSSAEAARIKRGEPSEMRLRPGDLAVSRDIEAQFRERGIRPGDDVTLHYADGTTHTGRWMDRTDGSLDGRFDLYSPEGPPENDGSKITGFTPGGQDPSTLNPQPSTPSTPEDLEDGSPNLHPNGVTPEEVLTFQQAQDAYRAANPDTATQPEALRTLAEQLDLVRDGGKPSMIFEGVTRDQIPAALRPIAGRESLIDGVQTPGGYVVFNKTAVRPLLGLNASAPYTSVQAAARTAFRNPAQAGQLLGYGTPEKPIDADHAQVIRTADGTEVLAVAANDQTAPLTAAALDRAVSRRAKSASNTIFREMPLAQFVMQNGGIMSRRTARQEGLYRTSKSLWDDAPDRLSSPEHNAIYGTTAPDELAQAAINAGLLPEGSTQRELWAALGEESTAARRQATAARQEDTGMAQLERLARREDLDLTLALRAKSRREESRQALRQTADPIRTAGPLPDPTDDPDFVPFSRVRSLNSQPSTLNRGVSPKTAAEALALIRQNLPAVADATRLVPNRDALAAELDDYRPQDWADMGPGGVQGFYDPRTGQTTVLLDNIELREGETPLRAVARIVLHERIAHAGLATLREADPGFARQWQQLTAQIPPAELQAIAEQYPELSGNVAALSEEWLAQQVEARAGQLLPANTLAGKLWHALKAALARVFARFSRPTPLQAEVDRVILLARNALKTQFVPASGPLRMAQARAKAGGEYGPNGEWYSGGAFIATRDMPKKIKEKIRKAASGKEQVRVGTGADKFSEIQPGKLPIVARLVGTYLGREGQVNEQFLAYQKSSPEMIAQVQAAGDALAKGKEFLSVYDFPLLANYTDGARLVEAGLPVPGTLLAKMPPDVAQTLIPKPQETRPAPPAGQMEMQFARPGQRSTVRYAGTGPYRVQNQGWRATLTGNALPKPFANLLAQGKNETAALNQAAAQIGQDLNAAVAAHAKAHGLTEADVLTLVDDAMANPSTLTALSDPRLKEATRKARNFLDDLSEAVATITGGQLGSAIMANRGSWMRRSYAAFDPAAGWNYDALAKAAAAHKSIAGQPAAKLLKDARDFLLTEDPRRTPAQIEAILRGMMDRGEWERALTGQSVSKPTESLMRRKELPDALRAVMGEERNPLKRYTLSAGFQAAFIARHEQQERIAQIGLQLGIFSTAREGVYTEAISDGAPTAAGQRRSGLAGLYTTPELNAALARSQGTTPDSLLYKTGDLIKFLSGEAKLNKVALSPDSYAVNLIGNVIGLVQTGDLLTLSSFRRMAEAIKVMNAGRPIAALGTAQALLQETRRAHLARLTAAGVADSSYSTADLLASLDNNVLQFIEADNRWNRASGGLRGAILGQGLGRIFGTTGQAIGAVAGAATGTALGGKRIVDAQKQIAQWTLGAPDRFGKILSFQNNYEAHRASGMTEAAAFELATEKTLNSMPDYSKMPDFAKQLSQLGIMGSFIGFQIEVYRNAFWNFRYAARELASGKPALMALGARRLLGASTVQVLALYGFQAIIAGLFAKGATDDEDEAYRRSLARPYEKFGRLAYTALDGEKASFFNTSYLLPQTTMWEIQRAAFEGKDFETALANAWAATQNQWLSGGVHSDPALEAIMNTRKGGSPVSTESGYRQVAERLTYYLRRALEPGAIDKLDRYVRANDGRDRNSRTFDIKEENLRLMGVRQTTYKHEDAIQSRLYEFKEEYQNAGASARAAWRDNAPGSRESAIRRANDRIAILRTKYQEFQKDLATLKLLPALQKANENRDSAGHKNTILPKEFKPMVATPDGPKFQPSK